MGLLRIKPVTPEQEETPKKDGKKAVKHQPGKETDFQLRGRGVVLSEKSVPLV